MGPMESMKSDPPSTHNYSFTPLYMYSTVQDIPPTIIGHVPLFLFISHLPCMVCTCTVALVSAVVVSCRTSIHLHAPRHN